MRIFVTHETSYTYGRSPESVIQLLRLTPRHHEGQYVHRWHLETSQDVRLHQREDAFGNVVHAFAAVSPLQEISLKVEGEVDIQDTHGVVRNTIEPFPPSLFLRETSLTRADPAITDFTQAASTGGGSVLDQLHRLLNAVNTGMTFDTDPTHVHTTAAEALALKRGVCQDLTHIFISCCRCLGVPARYVSGHMCRTDGVVQQSAGHAWAEAFVPDLGWLGFDPTNGVCPTDAYIRIAVGLDYLGAAPVRGARYGGDSETLNVSVRVNPSQWQRQG